MGLAPEFVVARLGDRAHRAAVDADTARAFGVEEAVGVVLGVGPRCGA